MSSKGNNNSGNNNSGVPFWLTLIGGGGLAGLIAAILGTGGLPGLIVLIRGTPATPTPTPSISRSPGEPQRSPEISPSSVTITPFPTPTRLIKYCLGIQHKFYFVTLRSKQSSMVFYNAAVITRILDDYPIASSRLKPGDGIVAIENNPIYSSEQLSDAVNAQTGGRPIRLYVFRPSRYAITPQGLLLAFEQPYEELTFEIPVKACP